MEKDHKIKYILDIVLFVTLLITGVSGLINPIIIGLNTERFLGINEDFWLTIHVLFGVITVVLVFIHLFLHKDWIVFSTKKFFEKKNIKKD
jgi:hypothetical protein